MKKKLIQVFQYILSLSIGIALMMYALQNIDLQDVIDKFKEAQFAWVFIAAGCFILSNLSRAARWKQLATPLGYNPSLYKAFLSVMVGYFVNLVFPRAGEVSRAAVMQKMDGMPATTVFGTIVLERIIDVFMLSSLIGILLLANFDNYGDIFYKFFADKVGDPQNLIYLILIALLGLVLMVLLFYLIRKRIQANPIFKKIAGFAGKMLEGLLSIRKVENKFVFVLHTLIIWGMYFIMSYCLFFCFENTSKLSLWVGYESLVMGAIGMAAPVQGGVGTYHILIGNLFYGYFTEMYATIAEAKTQSALMATFMHTSQTLVTIVTGGTCAILSLLVNAPKKETSVPKV